MISAELGDISEQHLWKRDIVLRQLEPLMDSLRLVSFDVFDTLLMRCCAQPGDVFNITAMKASERGLFTRPTTAAEYRTIRIAAERLARERDDTGFGETTLECIYEQVPERLGDRSRLLQLELEMERELCFLNPNAASLIRFCKQRGIRIALLSDMYLSSDQIVSILTTNGLDASLLDAVLVSSEEGCGKRSGYSYDSLLRTFPDISREQMIHIGDNEAADIQGASKRAIAAVHYTLIPETIESPFHWESVRHGAVLPAIAPIRKLAGGTFPATTSNTEVNALTFNEEPALESEDLSAQSFFYRFGAEILGPFVQGFCDWVIDQCVAAGRREIHPLMREAHLLGPALERSALRRGLSISVRPLYVSRQATLLASMNDFTSRELDQVLGLGHITVGDVLDLLGVEVSELSGEFPVLESMRAVPVSDARSSQTDEDTGVTLYDTLRQVLLEPSFRKRARDTIRLQRERLLEHIRQQCSSPDQLITVDLGFNGTIQAAIDSAYANEHIHNESIHLLAVGTERASLRLLQGTDLRCWIGTDTAGGIARRFARSPGLIEELMMGDFGSTVRYEKRADGTIVPITAKLNIPAEQLEYKRACQAGVLSFQSWYSYWQTTKPDLAAAADPSEWSLPLHRVLDMPTPEEAGRLGDLMHQDNFGGVQTVRLCESLPIEWETRGGDYLIDLSSFGPDTANVFWPQGTVTRSEPYRLYVSFLRLRDTYGSAVIAFNTINRLKDEGMDSVMLIGKGDFTERLLREALLQGIRIERILEPVPVIPTTEEGTTMRVLPQALEETIRNDPDGHTYVIGTLVDLQNCRRMLVDGYSLLNPTVQPRIVEPFA